MSFSSSSRLASSSSASLWRYRQLPASILNSSPSSASVSTSSSVVAAAVSSSLVASVHHQSTMSSRPHFTAGKKNSASAQWVNDLEHLLKKRDSERKRFESLANRPDISKEEADKIRLVSELMEKDEEVLELKRIHALSLERIQEHQRRSMQTSEEKGVYVEDAINKQVLDAFSNTEYNKTKVKEHAAQTRKMRYIFIGLKFLGTLSMWWFLHWWYSTDPHRMYVEKPSKLYFPRINTKQMEL